MLNLMWYCGRWQQVRISSAVQHQSSIGSRLGRASLSNTSREKTQATLQFVQNPTISCQEVYDSYNSNRYDISGVCCYTTMTVVLWCWASILTYHSIKRVQREIFIFRTSAHQSLKTNISCTLILHIIDDFFFISKSQLLCALMWLDRRLSLRRVSLLMFH